MHELTPDALKRQSIKALIFDLDGTLTDPYLGISRCVVHACKELGAPAPPAEHLKTFIGPPLHLSFAAMFDGDKQRAERAVSLFRERFSTVGIFENTVYDGIPKVLETLARSVDLFVCTSKPALYAERVVEHFGIRKYFRAIYGSEMRGERSNKIELLKWLLQKEALCARESAMIGDREHDILGACANGVAGYGVAWGYGSEAELTAAGAQHIFKTPAEILERWATMSIGTTLRTPRLELRPEALEDAKAIFDTLASDSRVTHYMDWQPVSAFNPVAAAERYAKLLDDMAAGKRIAWVIRKLDEAKICGKIELRIQGQDGEIGYILAPSHWGKGIVPEGVTAVLDFARRMGLRRIHGTCAPGNRASIRVFEKCGFRYTGRERAALLRPALSDEPRDSECYEIVIRPTETAK